MKKVTANAGTHLLNRCLRCCMGCNSRYRSKYQPRKNAINCNSWENKKIPLQKTVTVIVMILSIGTSEK